MSPTILLLHVFDAAGTCLPSRCLAIKGGIHFTEHLPSNDRGIHLQTHRLPGGIYKYAAEMGSGAMIYTQSFIKTGSGTQKLTGWG
jgi:hypothetical protein